MGRVIYAAMYNSIIAYKSYQVAGNYIPGNTSKYIRFEPLFATSSLCHSEAPNDQKVGVSKWS